MELCTQRIFLRPITQADTPMVLRWRNSEPVKRYFIYRKDITPQEHQQWMDQKVGTGKVVQFIIHLAQTGEPIGSVYIQNIDYGNSSAEYGIFIGEPSALGRGCGTDAALLAVRYAFETLGLHKLYLRVLSDNQRAIRSYEHVGFRVEGVLRDEVMIDGVYRDITRMSVLNEEKP